MENLQSARRVMLLELLALIGNQSKTGKIKTPRKELFSGTSFHNGRFHHKLLFKTNYIITDLDGIFKKNPKHKKKSSALEG